jgi:hypothetical protein
MTGSQPAPRHHERSNVRGAIITLIIEAAVVVTLAAIGFGISFVMLWLAG